MKLRLMNGSLVGVAAGWLLLSIAPSAALADFVADQFVTISREDNDGFLPSKIYTQGKKTRIEVSMAGRISVNISRGDKKPPVFWTLAPDEKMYMERMGEGGAADPLMGSSGGKIEKTFVAKETVDGHPCNKFKISWKDDLGKRRSGFAWEATDLTDVPIRQEFYGEGERILVQLKNIEIKTLDPALFEIPNGYKKLSLPPNPAGKNRVPAPPRP